MRTILSILALVLLWSAALLVPTPDVWAGPPEGDLDGAYEFLRMETPDGPDETQKGMMIVKDGFICHVRVPIEREKITQDDSEEERQRKSLAAFLSANATCGSFSVEDGKVLTVWMAAANPNSEGNKSEFVFEREADLLIVAPAGAPQFKFVYRQK